MKPYAIVSRRADCTLFTSFSSIRLLFSAFSRCSYTDIVSNSRDFVPKSNIVTQRPESWRVLTFHARGARRRDHYYFVDFDFPPTKLFAFCFPAEMGACISHFFRPLCCWRVYWFLDLFLIWFVAREIDGFSLLPASRGRRAAETSSCTAARQPPSRHSLSLSLSNTYPLPQYWSDVLRSVQCLPPPPSSSSFLHQQRIIRAHILCGTVSVVIRHERGPNRTYCIPPLWAAKSLHSFLALALLPTLVDDTFYLMAPGLRLPPAVLTSTRLDVCAWSLYMATNMHMKRAGNSSLTFMCQVLNRRFQHTQSILCTRPSEINWDPLFVFLFCSRGCCCFSSRVFANGPCGLIGSSAFSIWNSPALVKRFLSWTNPELK